MDLSPCKSPFGGSFDLPSVFSLTGPAGYRILNKQSVKEDVFMHIGQKRSDMSFPVFSYYYFYFYPESARVPEEDAP